MMKYLFIVFTSFTLSFGYSQNEKDIILTQTIPKLLLKNTVDDYFKAKEILLNLEKEYGEFPEHKLQLLSASYGNGDLDFFKVELLHLVEKYGLDIIQLDKRINYYQALTIDELATWFKENYPEKRIKWLKDNFEKLSLIKALDDLYVKDQTLASFATSVNSIQFKDPKDKDSMYEVLINESKNHFAELLDIYKKIGRYPSAKTFALPQSPYFLVETHVLKTPSISLDCLNQIYPYYENAYINNEIDYLVFKNYDSQLLLSTGKQYFGTLKESEVPKAFLDENGKILVADAENLNRRRSRLGWD